MSVKQERQLGESNALANLLVASPLKGSFGDLGKELSQVRENKRDKAIAVKFSSLTLSPADVGDLLEIREAFIAAKKISQTSWNAIITKALHIAARTITGNETLVPSKVPGEQVSINSFIENGMGKTDARIKVSFAASADTSKILEDIRIRFYEVNKSIPSASQVIRTLIVTKKAEIIEGA